MLSSKEHQVDVIFFFFLKIHLLYRNCKWHYFLFYWAFEESKKKHLVQMCKRRTEFSKVSVHLPSHLEQFLASKNITLICHIPIHQIFPLDNYIQEKIPDKRALFWHDWVHAKSEDKLNSQIHKILAMPGILKILSEISLGTIPMHLKHLF